MPWGAAHRMSARRSRHLTRECGDGFARDVPAIVDTAAMMFRDGLVGC